MGEETILRAIDSLYSKGRHHDIKLICAGHTVTDLSVKWGENTPIVHLTTNSSLLSSTRFEDSLI